MKLSKNYRKLPSKRDSLNLLMETLILEQRMEFLTLTIINFTKDLKFNADSRVANFPVDRSRELLSRELSSPSLRFSFWMKQHQHLMRPPRRRYSKPSRVSCRIERPLSLRTE